MAGLRRHDTSHTTRQLKFAEQIKQFAERKPETHLFCGQHFKALSDFFDNTGSKAAESYDPGQAPHSSSSTGLGGASTPGLETPPAYLIPNKEPLRRNVRSTTSVAVSSLGEYGDGSNLSAPAVRSVAVAVNASDNLETMLNQHMPTTPNASLLVFLRGWQSPVWLRILGAQCGIDPEMIRRHLSFLNPGNKFFDQPPLPSQQLSIWRIRTVTISVYEESRDTLNLEEVESRRLAAGQDVRTYLQKLGRPGSQFGSSIIRKYSVIDGSTSVIEQDISFCATVKKNRGWIGKTPTRVYL